MNTNTSITLPYGMQPSDKALRLLAGVTNVTKINSFVLGNQILFKKSIEEENWNFGDEFEYSYPLPQQRGNGEMQRSFILRYIIICLFCIYLMSCQSALIETVSQ